MIDTLFADCYKIEEKLGEGSMSEVYKAKVLERNLSPFSAGLAEKGQTSVLQTGEHVALKALSRLSSSEIGRRFEREYSTLSKLNHPNIVKVFDYGTYKEAPFIVMEYLPGITLRDFMKEASPEAVLGQPSYLYNFLSQLTDALSYIHSQGIIHRDLKPGNIMLCPENVNEKRVLESLNTQVKLLDFGLVKLPKDAGFASSFSQKTRLTSADSILGTAMYVAPEQAKGIFVDGRSDLYSLGVILYEMVVGEPPFLCQNPMALLIKQISDVPVPPRKLNPSIEAELQQIILTLLSKEPILRYQSAEELLEEISKISGLKIKKLSVEAKSPTVRRALLSPMFVGREVELNKLYKLADKTMAGRGCTVLIEGESGIGKTHLIRELSSYARLRGFKVLSSCCYLHQQAPYQPIKEALAPYIRISFEDKGELRAKEKPLDFLFSLSPVSQKEEVVDGLRPVQSTEIFDSLIRFILSLKQEHPILLCIEDIHWADEMTQQFLSYMANRIENHPILLCVSYRGEEIQFDQPSKHSLVTEKDEKMTAKPEAEKDYLVHLSLKKLSAEETEKLAASMLGEVRIPDELKDWLSKETEGNPFYITEMMEALADKGILYYQDAQWCVGELGEKILPEGIKEVIEARLSQLSDGEREILCLASVIGRRFDFDALMRLCGESEKELNASISSFLNLGFILEDDASEKAYAFSHVKFRDVLYEDTDLSRRRGLHEQIGEILEVMYADRISEVAVELAYHFSECKNYQKTVQYSIMAGDTAQNASAYNAAFSHYLEAQKLIDSSQIKEYLSGDKLDTYLKLRYNLASVAEFLSRFDESLGCFEALLSSAQANRKDELAADVMCRLGFAYGRSAETQKAEAMFTSSLAYYEGVNSRMEITVLRGLAGLYSKSGNPDKAAILYERAIKLCDELGDRSGKIERMAMLSRIRFHQGKLKETEQLCRTLMSLYEEERNTEEERLIPSLLPWSLYYRGELAQAEEYFNLSFRRAKKLSKKRSEARALHGKGRLYLQKMDVSKAHTFLTESLRLYLEMGKVGELPEVYRDLSELFLAEGELSRAEDYALKARDKVVEEDVSSQGTTLMTLGKVLAAEGKLKEAQIHLEDGLELLLKHNSKLPIGEGYLELGRYLKKIEDIEGAKGALSKAVSIFKESSAKIYLGISLLERSTITKEGDRHQALADILESEEIFKEKDLQYWLKKTEGVKEELMKETTLETNLHSQVTAEMNPDEPTSRFILAGSSRLLTLYEVAKTINSILEIDVLLDTITELIRENLSASRGLIVLAEGENLNAARFYNLEQSDVKEISQTVISDVIKNGQPILTADATLDERFSSSSSIIAHQIKSIMCAPLICRDRTIGAVYVDRRSLSEAFKDIDLQFLLAFSNLAAIALENARLHGQLLAENFQLKRELSSAYRFSEIIGDSDAMQEVYRLMSSACMSDITVLIEGETGVGKELVARAIHYNGTRKDKPFIVQSCAALPVSLLESELFGHVKGAFTGALKDKPGLFEIADGGTIFLDEIGDAEPSLQSNLLRVLQEGELKRVGDTQTRKVDVRVIAATNRELLEDTEQGRFREDLYYRLKVLSIVVPPLRERKSDIPLLIEHFLSKHKKRSKKSVSISQQAILLLTNHSWPGNVRELENEIKRAIALVEDGGVITGEILSEQIREQTKLPLEEPSTLKEAVESLERRMIEKALKDCGFVKTQAALQLGITRQGLIKKISRYKIEA